MAAAIKSRDWRKRKPSSHTNEVRHTREALPAETIARIEALEAAVDQLSGSLLEEAAAKASIIARLTQLDIKYSDVNQRYQKLDGDYRDLLQQCMKLDDRISSFQVVREAAA